MFLKTKTYVRWLKILANSFNTFLPTLTNIITSAIVIRLFDSEWWGQITILQLYMFLGAQFSAWGNRDSLLKLFSEHPSDIKSYWIQSFSSRLFFLIPILAGTYFVSENFIEIFYLSIWIVLRYFNQSFESIILFSRDFISSILAEIFGLLFTCLGLLIFKDSLSYNEVLLVLTIGYLFKMIVLTIKFKSFFSFSYLLKPDFKKLMTFFPFMVISFMGVLQQKVDIISMTWFLSKNEIAQYQVYSSFLLFAHSIPGLLISPYIKNIYRLPKSIFSKLNNYFLGLGLVISVISIALIYIAITLIYQFNFSFTLYLLGFINILLTYFYILEIFILFKYNKQKHVMIINGVIILINFIFCYLLIEELKIQGAILANIICQIIIYLSYKFYLRFNLSIKL
ncbi:MAG: hypothetical protein ACOVO9_12030 [Bacteroidia bacterium]